MRPILLSLAALLLLGIASSCKKYEFGPYLSLLSKKERVAGAWKVDSAITRFGDDIAPEFSTYTFAFERNGSATIFFTATTLPDTLYGEWSLEEEKDIFQWKDLAGDTTGFYYTRNESFDILRLTGSEFRLADKDNTFLYLSPQ
jgi:hypothetical protein